MDDKLVWNGENISLDQLCRNLGIDIKIVRTFMDNGDSPEEAVNRILAVKGFDDPLVEPTVLTRYKKYRYKGETRSLSYFCRKYGLSFSKMSFILTTTDSFADAVRIYRRQQKKELGENSVEYKGDVGLPYDVARRNGIVYASLYQAKKRSGRTYDEMFKDQSAFDAALDQPFVFEDFKGTIRDAISCYDLNMSSILRRYSPYSSSSKESGSLSFVVETEILLKRVEDQELSICGFKGTPKQICKEMGISYPTHQFVKSCREPNCDLTALVTGIIRHNYEVKLLLDGPYTLDGFSGTVKEICDHFSMNYRTVVNVIIRSSESDVNSVLAMERCWADACNTSCMLPGYNGTLLECAEYADLPIGKLKLLIKDGNTPQQALNKVYSDYK